MTDYDALFADTVPDDSVFAAKGALDPLADPDEIIARTTQERTLATILNGVGEGYLPPMVSVYGPPGTGKTLTIRCVCRAFAARTDAIAVSAYPSAASKLAHVSASILDANAPVPGITGTFVGSYRGAPAGVRCGEPVQHVRSPVGHRGRRAVHRGVAGPGRPPRRARLG